jgi:hypothetical protein
MSNLHLRTRSSAVSSPRKAPDGRFCISRRATTTWTGHTGCPIRRTCISARAPMFYATTEGHLLPDRGWGDSTGRCRPVGVARIRLPTRPIGPIGKSLAHQMGICNADSADDSQPGQGCPGWHASAPPHSPAKLLGTRFGRSSTPSRARPTVPAEARESAD